MSSYNGATFLCRIPDGFRPDWEQEPNVNRRHIPYANRDDVQGGGRGNLRITIPAKISDDSGLALLRAAVGVTKRTLADYYGTNYTNTMLVAVRSPRRLANTAEWFVDLDFEREGT